MIIFYVLFQGCPTNEDTISNVKNGCEFVCPDNLRCIKPVDPAKTCICKTNYCRDYDNDCIPQYKQYSQYK